MTPKKLRFSARGTAMVQNLQKLEANIKSFIGRKYVEVSPGVWGFTPNGVEEVEYTTEYVRACKEGDLHPADQDTATACGVAYEHDLDSVDEAEKA